jgi:hypothetical protein
MRAIDRLNSRFGRGTIAFGTADERQVTTARPAGCPSTFQGKTTNA